MCVQTCGQCGVVGCTVKDPVAQGQTAQIDKTAGTETQGAHLLVGSLCVGKTGLGLEELALLGGDESQIV